MQQDIYNRGTIHMHLRETDERSQGRELSGSLLRHEHIVTVYSVTNIVLGGYVQSSFIDHVFSSSRKRLGASPFFAFRVF
jgi:hypothetical protein